MHIAGFGRYQRALASWGNSKDVAPTATSSLLGRNRTIEKLWRKFFSDPSQWWDNRAEKVNPRYPDFKHKITQESLWLDAKLKPIWVDVELAALAPGTLRVDVFTWNKRLERYVKTRQFEKTLQLFQQMQRECMHPDKFTFVPILNACSNLRALEEGRRIHVQIMQVGCESDIYVGNCLIDMYANCGSIGDAFKVFIKMGTRDVVSWNSMILGYVKCGEGQRALELFQEMERESVEPNHVTFLGVLNACASIAALEEGLRIHAQIIERGYESDVFLGSSLVDMYAKCGSIEDAQRVFDKMCTHDVVAWSALILGYVKYRQGQKALKLFWQMQQEGVKPDAGTFVGVLNACASVAAMEEGRWVHEQIVSRGFESDIFVGNSLVDMYSKCGSIEDARRVFERMPTHDLVSWTAMLGGYATHGHAKETFAHFERMCEEGLEMTGRPFIPLLSACSHGGLVEEGLYYFERMNRVYNVSPTVEHYACLIDILGRAGRIQEAKDQIMIMPYEPDAAVWMSLLGACRVHGNVELAELVAKQLMELDCTNVRGDVLLSNIYAAAGRWDSSATIQRERLQNASEETGNWTGQGC